MESLFDDPMIREIYRRGVRDAVAFACVLLPASRQRVMEEWLTELDLWRGGNPPPPPPMRAEAIR